MQTITSRKTSRNQVPSLFRADVVRDNLQARNLDVGGGRFETATNYLASRGTANRVYDPYNRAFAHNMETIEARYYPTATLANVLNVINSESGRAYAIGIAAENVVDGGLVFVSCYEGDRSGEGCETRDGWQENRKLDTYVRELESTGQFTSVKRVGRVIVGKVYNPRPSARRA